MNPTKNIEDRFVESISSEDIIFHYTKKATALENILPNDCFKFSPIINSNDPYEYKRKISGAVGWGWNEENQEQIYQSHDIANKLLLDNLFFASCCSNTSADGTLKNNGWLKSRMWSQYGESHKGVCLAFSKKELIKILYEKYKTDEYLIYDDTINYKENLNEYLGHTSMGINGDIFDKNTPVSVAIEHIEKFHKELLFQKQNDYRDEQEYRMVILNKDYKTQLNSQPEFKVSKCLVGIILGERFPEVYIPAVKKLCEDKGFSYRGLHWEYNKYFLLNNA